MSEPKTKTGRSKRWHASMALMNNVLAAQASHRASAESHQQTGRYLDNAVRLLVDELAKEEELSDSTPKPPSSGKAGVGDAFSRLLMRRFDAAKTDEEKGVVRETIESAHEAKLISDTEHAALVEYTK